MESKNPITVKLLIDTNANKVLFAEASKDFIDFLFFLLSLPIGTVIKLLADNNSLSGSIGNLYSSFQNLNESYLEPNLNKSVLLNPKPSISLANVPLLMGTTTTNTTTSNGGFSYASAYNGSSKFSTVYLCYICGHAVTNMYNGVTCPKCNYLGTMTKELPCISATGTISDSSSSSTNASYVKGGTSYIVTDDLSVTPMSMISSITMMNKFNVSNLSVLQEKNVQVGTKEALAVLKASLRSSSTALTDVFIRRM